jgi:hypothetical protein
VAGLAVNRRSAGSAPRWLGVVALLALGLGLGLWKWWAQRAHVAVVDAVAVVPQTAPVQAPLTLREGKAITAAPEADRAQPAARDARVHGFVLGPDGAPVSGAFVESQPRGTRLAATGENGEFWFALARDSLVVRARQGELQSPPAIAHAGVAAQELLLTLKASGTLLVQVSSALTRKPVAGAQLQLTRNGEPLASEQRSDDRGGAKFSLSRGGHLLVRATADGFGATARGFWASTASTGEQRITLALPPEYVAYGRVQSRDGTPAAHVVVVATDVSSNQPPATAQTDSTGRYRLGQLYAGVFRFEAMDQLLGHGVTPAIELQPSTLVNLTLDSDPALGGVVFDERDQPVPAATVVLWPQAEGAYRLPEQRQQRSDASGSFRFVGLPTARVKLVATLGDTSSAVVEVELARQQTVALHLQATQVISGRVVNSGGNYIPNATVRAQRVLAPGAPGVASALDENQANADERGQFVLPTVGAGQWRLFAYSPTDLMPDTGAVGRVLATVDAGATGVVLVVTGTGAIEGWVELEEGGLPEAATLLVAGRPLVSPSGGTFFFEGIPEGTHDITVTGPEFEAMLVKAVTVRSGETTSLDGIKVRSGRRLRGRVTTAHHAPVGGAQVMAGTTLYAAAQGLNRSQAEDEPELRTAYTDDAGGVELRGLAHGAFGIMAEHPAYGRSAIAALDDDLPGPLELVIQPTSNVRGAVTRSGTPIEGIAIVGKDAGGFAAFTATTGRDGRYELVHLPPGSYVVAAVNRQQDGSYDLRRQELTLSAGRDGVANFELGEPLPSRQSLSR